jgi:DNA-binding transcriptional LysR family regulator
MDLFDALSLFRRVAERRHFAAAAKDLNISQATVTRTVQYLERHFQVELVRRSTRELALTDAGERLHRRSAALLEAISRLKDDVAGVTEGSPSGALRVTAPSAFGVVILAPMAARFRTCFPSVSLDIVLTDRFLDLIAENVDLAIRVGPQGDSRLIRRKLGYLPEALVCSPDYLALQGSPETPTDAESHSFVGLSALRNAREGLRLVHKSGKTAVLRAQAGLSFDTPLGVREAILAGAGMGRIHRYLVAGDLETGRLIEMLPGWRCPDWEIALVSTARERSRAAEVFEEDLRRTLETVDGVELLGL